MNRRNFLGMFVILPGAGRIWKAVRPEPVWPCVPQTWKFVSLSELIAEYQKTVFKQVGIPDEVLARMERARGPDYTYARSILGEWPPPPQESPDGRMTLDHPSLRRA